jgi:DNA-binding transcriptional ArsR family regulator
MSSPQPTPSSPVERFEALASPARLELVEALQLAGPSTAAELAARLGRAPDSLYHHLRQLRRAGILVEAGHRSTGGRRGVVFELVPGSTSGDGDATTPAAERVAMGRLAGALLRMTERDVQASLGPRWAQLLDQVAPETELPTVRRLKAWLDQEQLDELGRRLAAVEDFLRAHLEPPRPTPRDPAATGDPGPAAALYSLTLALTPLWPRQP